MYGSRMFMNMFAQPAPGIMGAYGATMDILNRARQESIKNALSQIDLDAAPQLSKENLAQQAAKTAVLQNQANYAPQLSALTLQQKQIQNAMSSEKFKELPQQFQAGMAIKNAQLEILKQRLQGGMQQSVNQGAVPQVQSAPMQAANYPMAMQIQPQQAQNAPSMTSDSSASFIPQAPAIPPDAVAAALAAARGIKDPRRLMTAYDPNTGMQVQIPKNYMAPGGATLNLLLPAGPSTRGGMPSALYDPATKESLSVIGQQQRNKVQNQVYAAQLAQELLPAIKAYGTEGKFQAAGISKYFPQWAGGTTFDDAAKYQMAKNMAVEHIMSSTNLRSTDQTTSMMNAVLDRQNGESREGYTERMDAFDKKLQGILDERNRTLRLGAMPLEKEQEDKANAFLMNAYNKALAARKGGGEETTTKTSTVQMIGEDGKTYNIPSDKIQEATKEFKMRLK
jgi:hypothetical protein